jgi:hypothetical protein
LRLLLTILVTVISAYAPVLAQKTSIDNLMKIRPVAIGYQKVDTFTAVYLPMRFAEADFITTHQLKKIPGPDVVYSVNLVYTRYRDVDSFNQPKLNYHRFKALEKVYPEIFAQSDVQWNVLEQRGATTKNKAEKSYHGFVIYLKNAVPKDMVDKEIKKISDAVDSYKDTLVWVPEKIEYKIKRRKVETGYYLPNNEKKRKAGEKYSSKSIWFREPEMVVKYDSTIKKKSGGYWKKIGKYDTSVFKGTDEFDFLTRRKWSPKMAVVADVTGSMSPFSTQIMLWLKYSPEVLKQGRFAFFNDGDAVPEPFKKIGSTGGIYFAGTPDFDSIYAVLKQTMYKGLGGDIPENNLEAVIKTLNRWPDTDTILMIADMNAPVKDISLLPQIKKPVSVMLCGTSFAVPKDYIDIVKATGGKLYMLNTEISNLKGLYSGQRIEIGGHLFEWNKNTFHFIR